MTVKKYADPEFQSQDRQRFLPWTERVLADHDQAVNRISNVINSMVSRECAQKISLITFIPEMRKSMRADNIPKIIREMRQSKPNEQLGLKQPQGKMRSLSRRSR